VTPWCSAAEASTPESGAGRFCYNKQYLALFRTGRPLGRGNVPIWSAEHCWLIVLSFVARASTTSRMSRWNCPGTR
jgi:hypothetical protein